MSKQSLSFTAPNQAWILHRDEVTTTINGVCNIYALLDAYSGYCFAHVISIDLPYSKQIINLLKSAHSEISAWPTQILILKTDPLLEPFQAICSGMKIPLIELTAKDLKPFIREFKESIREFGKTKELLDSPPPLSEVERAEIDAFVPDSYAPCPCASGKKYRFCCQKSAKDITFAMCAAQDGDRDEALNFMKRAEEKVGRTSEILCRYAICWSFFDMNKSNAFLEEAIKLNPKHPRTNYILGIEAVADNEFEKAIVFYKTAIANYPNEDKFHLNETYNNLGTAYYSLKRYKEAKEAWETGLVLFPLDQMVKKNLFEFIYENPLVPKEIREISPFIAKYLPR